MAKNETDLELKSAVHHDIAADLALVPFIIRSLGVIPFVEEDMA